MPRDITAWLDEFTGRVPRANRALVRVIARLLASETDPGTLLNVSEALKEAATELLFDGWTFRAADLAVIDGMVCQEARVRAVRAR
jgi:hypothetical protein